VRIYEINTWVWLAELTERYGRTVTLETVPVQEWDALVPYCFDAVWLMGVWQRSPVGRAVARADGRLREQCRELLADVTEDDLVASPYCVHAYVVDERFGGPAGLAAARTQLAKRKLKLILDFVPNHTAPDTLWTFLHPEYYIQGTTAELECEPWRYYLADSDDILARGATARAARDVWTDTAQINAFSPGYRESAILTLIEVASQCDGVRCDMAMLMLNEQFGKHWQLSPVPEVDYWQQVIAQLRRRVPEFIFIAECYGETAWALQQQGFDYCYDKDKLYERLSNGDAESVRQHLRGSDPEFLRHLLHFLENHDEPPAVEQFQPAGRHQVAALAIATLPGASLWYDRQFEGRWGKLPVQLGRSLSIQSFYKRLLKITSHAAIQLGKWSWCSIAPEGNLLAWCWTLEQARLLVVINLSSVESWGRVALPWQELRGNHCVFDDLLSGEHFGPHDGTELLEQGLVVGRLGWGVHLFEISVQD